MKFVSLSINDWLAAIADADLTLEQQAVLHRLVLLACRREANLVNDDASNAKMLGLQVRPWRRVKRALLEKRVVDIVDGELVTRFASEAIAAYAEHRNRAAEGGRKSAAQRMIAASLPETSPQVSAKFEPNFGGNSRVEACSSNDLAATTPNPSPNPYPNPKERESSLSLKNDALINHEVKGQSATVVSLFDAKPVDPNWQPSEVDAQYAKDRGLCDEEIAEQSEAFVSHFLQTTRNPLSRNWSEAWKGWVRNYDAKKSPVGRARLSRSLMATLKAAPAADGSSASAPLRLAGARGLSDEGFVRSSLQMWISFKDPQHWPRSLGFTPSDHRCAVPDELLAEFGIRKPAHCTDKADYSLPISDRVLQEMGVA